MTGEGGRAALLEAFARDVAANGVGERSLRQIAAALGTSHRMLIYHFGSKQGLLVEVVRVMERRQREALAAFEVGDAPPGEVARRFWAHLADPGLWPHERLFFEVYGRALQGDPAAAPLLDGIVEAWIEPLAASMRRAGVQAHEADVLARLGLGVARGLLLDLLATGDRGAVDAAMEQFVAMVESRLPAPADGAGRETSTTG